MLSILKHWYVLDLNFANPTHFQSLEVVDRGSETQFQVPEKYLSALGVRLCYFVNFINHLPRRALMSSTILALTLLTFTTRRMVRSAHLALSPIHFTAQFDFYVSETYSYEKMHTSSLGTARWADLSTRHHIKPSPKGSGLMWWLVLRWIHVAFPTMPYAYMIALMSTVVACRCV